MPKSMKILMPLALVVLFLASCSHPDKQIVKVTSAKFDTLQIPKTIRYKGIVDTAVKFIDDDGEHVILTAHDYDGDAANNRLNGIYLYAYCYALKGDKWSLTWQMRDFTRECEFDLSGGFEPNSFAVTDLNKDGRAEVWLMYSMACRSDMSPSDLKVIMHEGTKKYAMRGSSRVRVNGTDHEGGEYKFDPAFKNGAQIFRQ